MGETGEGTSGASVGPSAGVRGRPAPGRSRVDAYDRPLASLDRDDLVVDRLPVPLGLHRVNAGAHADLLEARAGEDDLLIIDADLDVRVVRLDDDEAVVGLDAEDDGQPVDDLLRDAGGAPEADHAGEADQAGGQGVTLQCDGRPIFRSGGGGSGRGTVWGLCRWASQRPRRSATSAADWNRSAVSSRATGR